MQRAHTVTVPSPRRGDATPPVEPVREDGQHAGLGTGMVGCVLIGAIAVVTAVCYLLSPKGYGSVVFSAYAIGCVIGTGVYTRLRRPAVPWAWACLTACGGLFLAGIAIRSFTAPPGPAGIQMTSTGDLWTAGGYVALAAFLHGLTPSRLRRDPVATLDALAVIAAGAMVTWAVLVNPALAVPGASSWDRLAVTASPAGDVVILFLLTRLVLVTGGLSRAIGWTVVGILGMFVGDLGYALHGAGLLGGVSDAELSVWYVIGYAGILLTARHGSHATAVPEADADTGAPRRLREGWVRRVVLFLSVTTPIGVLLLWPHSTDAELWVGGGLAFAQSCISFARLMVSLTRISRQESDAWRAARTDEVTGLANRLRITEVLQGRFAAGGQPSLVLADLATLPEFEATFGTQVADAVLRAVTGRLGELDLPGCSVGIVDRRTVAVVAPDARTAAPLADRLREALGEPVTVDGVGECVLATSVARSAHGADAEGLWRSTRIAAERARRTPGGDVVVFTPELADASTQRLAVAQALHTALDAFELSAHYQPLFAADGGALIGYEALMRWTSRTLGWVSPGVFIPVAEQTGAIVELGTWILQTACHQLAEWRARPGLENVHMSVNLAPRQLAAPTVVRTVEHVLAVTGLPPDALWLEVTETDLMTDRKAAVAQLEQLRALGVTLAIDDFGTGYSSLEYLATLPVDVLKLDQSFVRRLGSGRDNQIVEAMTALAHAVGLTVVAEGVETPLQVRELQRVGVDHLQGFLLGKPLPACDATHAPASDQVPAVVSP